MINTEVTMMMIVVVMPTTVTLDLFPHLRFVECAEHYKPLIETPQVLHTCTNVSKPSVNDC
jgi:hypothetical protein